MSRLDGITAGSRIPRKALSGAGRRRTPRPLGRVQDEPSRPPPAGPGPSSPGLLTARFTVRIRAPEPAFEYESPPARGLTTGSHGPALLHQAIEFARDLLAPLGQEVARGVE